MPQHITRLILLLVAFLAIAYAGIVWLTDPSFYRFGHYRADVVPELANAPSPRYRGTEHCRECHADRHSNWDGGAHRVVRCEACHGPAGDHPEQGGLPRPDDVAALCSQCHEAMPARPAHHPQVVLEEHPYPNASPVPCSDCHDPHSPGMADAAATETPAATALTAEGIVAPESAARCKGCHGARGEGKGAFPAIAGMPPGDFVRAMNAYKTGERDSKPMARLAAALDDGEIRTLANFYAGLAAKEE